MIRRSRCEALDIISFYEWLDRERRALLEKKGKQIADGDCAEQFRELYVYIFWRYMSKSAVTVPEHPLLRVHIDDECHIHYRPRMRLDCEPLISQTCYEREL